MKTNLTGIFTSLRTSAAKALLNVIYAPLGEEGIQCPKCHESLRVQWRRSVIFPAYILRHVEPVLDRLSEPSSASRQLRGSL